MPVPTPQEILYMKEHITDNRAPELVAALAVNFTLACIAVILRLVSRYVSRSGLQADDHNVIAALVIVIGQLIVNLIGVNLGAGKHVILLKKPTAFAQIVLASEVFYVLGTALVKFSVLYLYKRLFGTDRRFRQLLWAIGGFVAAYSLVEILVLIFQCRPVNATWDMHVHGTCVNIALGAVIVGSINVVVDVLVLFLPVRMVWNLKMKKKWKLQLIGIFLLGGFVCIGSIVRVTTLHKLSLVDATWVDVDSAIWAMVENCIGIVSACLPTLRPLFNLLAHGHHCSSTHGPCPYCSKQKSSPFSSEPSAGGLSSGAPQSNWSGETKVASPQVPEQASWAGAAGIQRQVVSGIGVVGGNDGYAATAPGNTDRDGYAKIEDDESLGPGGNGVGNTRAPARDVERGDRTWVEMSPVMKKQTNVQISR